jgi:hypothetical protein
MTDEPDVLYHYTDAGAFAAIVEHRKLRATDIRFLNDPLELRYAWEALLLHSVSDKLRSGAPTAPSCTLTDNAARRLLLSTSLVFSGDKVVFTRTAVDPLRRL